MLKNIALLEKTHLVFILGISDISQHKFYCIFKFSINFEVFLSIDFNLLYFT